MKKTAKLLCLVLALALLLCSCAMPQQEHLAGGAAPVSEATVTGANEYFESASRRTIPYDQMEYARPDVEAVRTRCAELAALIEDAPDFDTVMAYDNEMGELFTHFNTMSTLAYLRSFQDTEDAFYEAEMEFMNEAGVEMELIGNDFNRALLESKWAEQYRYEIGTHTYGQIENSLLLNSPSVTDYKKEREQLSSDYDRLSSTATVSIEEVGDLEYTYTDIMGVGSDSLRQSLLLAFYDTYKDQFAEMYRRMVELDKLIAHELGFASAADMYYLSYDRDYSTADALTLCENAKQTFVPLYYEYYTGYETGEMDLDAVMAEMPGALEQVHPQLRECWDFLLEYGLYDYEARPTKMTSGQFCTNIADYDAPFTLTYWNGDFNSATTLIHEFGHFHDFWMHYETPRGNLDVAEVYSQALEMLFFPLYDRFTPYAENAVLSQLLSTLVNSLIFQSLLEEFQFRAYELDTFDADVLGNLLAQIYYEYGLGYPPDMGGPNHYWMMIGHFFRSPFYTISYVTSAVGALQIWAASQDDWEGGVQIYMDMLAAPQNQPFTDLLESVGLAPVHELSTLRNIAAHYEDVFSNGYVDVMTG